MKHLIYLFTISFLIQSCEPQNSNDNCTGATSVIINGINQDINFYPDCNFNNQSQLQIMNSGGQEYVSVIITIQSFCDNLLTDYIIVYGNEGYSSLDGGQQTYGNVNCSMTLGTTYNYSGGGSHELTDIDYDNSMVSGTFVIQGTGVKPTIEVEFEDLPIVITFLN
jgi:hypothetical protein